jgi:hypothetical protein
MSRDIFLKFPDRAPPKLVDITYEIKIRTTLDWATAVRMYFIGGIERIFSGRNKLNVFPGYELHL